MIVQFNHENGFTKDGRVYCEVFCVPISESCDELLSSGWNPSMEEKGVWYQSRSSRIDLTKYHISNQRKNFIEKLEKKIFDYKKDNQIDEFFFLFYDTKNYDIKDLYLNCNDFFSIKILEVKYKDEIVAYARYVENLQSNLFLNLAYIDRYPKLSLGTNLFHILADITKSQNKNYLYIYETYDDIYTYKQKFSGVEIWDGIKWNSNE